jgi:hypothetical protein
MLYSHKVILALLGRYRVVRLEDVITLYVLRPDYLRKIDQVSALPNIWGTQSGYKRLCGR